jgi:hypothetical protein
MKLAQQLLFLILMFLAAHAIAQDPAGKFTISHDARWGSAVLPAGSYDVSVHSGPVPFVLVTSESRSAVSIMAVAQYIEAPDCSASRLELEQSNGAWNVRSLCLASEVSVFFASHGEAAQLKAAPEPPVKGQ